jgi:hypothetical protein
MFPAYCHHGYEDGEGMFPAYCHHGYPWYRALMYAQDNILFDDAFCHFSRVDNS